MSSGLKGTPEVSDFISTPQSSRSVAASSASEPSTTKTASSKALEHLGEVAAKKSRALQKDRLLAKAATCIQRIFRGHLARKRVKKLLQEKEERARVKATVRIQALIRGRKARKEAATIRESDHQKCLQGSAVTVQKLIRGFTARKLADNLREEKHLKERQAAALVIQKVYRGHRGRRKAHLERKRKEAERRQLSASIVQRVYRGHLGRLKTGKRREVVNQQKKETQALLIQRVFRGYLGRIESARVKDFRQLVEIESLSDPFIRASKRKASTAVPTEPVKDTSGDREDHLRDSEKIDPLSDSIFEKPTKQKSELPRASGKDRSSHISFPEDTSKELEITDLGQEDSGVPDKSFISGKTHMASRRQGSPASLGHGRLSPISGYDEPRDFRVASLSPYRAHPAGRVHPSVFKRTHPYLDRSKRSRSVPPIMRMRFQ